jgi:hypothetical protein
MATTITKEAYDSAQKTAQQVATKIGEDPTESASFHDAISNNNTTAVAAILQKNGIDGANAENVRIVNIMEAAGFKGGGTAQPEGVYRCTAYEYTTWAAYDLDNGWRWVVYEHCVTWYEIK